MPKQTYTVFFNHLTSNEREIIILLCSLFALCSSGIIGIPIWFQQPEFQCFKADKWTNCNENQICTNNYIFRQNPLHAINSLSIELNLFCENKYIHRLMISFMFFGGFLGCLLTVMMPVHPKNRIKSLSILAFIFAMSNFAILIFNNAYCIAFSFGTISFCCMIINSYCLAAVNEIFIDEIAKICSILLPLCWGIFGVFFTIFCWFVQSDWKLVLCFPAIIILILSVFLWFYKLEKPSREINKTPTNIVELIKEIYPQPAIRDNFIIYVLVWTATSITYNDILLELNTVGNNIYLNMSFIAIIEILASYAAGVVGIRFDALKSMKIFIGISIGLYFCFWNAPVVSNASNIYLGVLLLAKFISETISYLIYIYAPKMITEKFTAFFFIFGRLTSRFCLLMLPHINHFFRQIGLHPFAFLSFIWVGSFGLVFLTNTNKQNKILNTINVKD